METSLGDGDHRVFKEESPGANPGGDDPRKSIFFRPFVPTL